MTVPERYIPSWMFDAVVADIANHFLRHDLSLSQLALKFSRGLSSSYIEIHPTEFQQTAELLLMFLSEIDANENAADFLCGFGFFRVNYHSENRRRNLNPTFSSIETGSRQRGYNGHETLKKFRAYVFSRRSNIGIIATPGWSLSLQSELPTLAKLSRDLTDVFLA